MMVGWAPLPWRRAGVRARIVWSTALLSAAAMAVMAAAVVVIATRLTHGRVEASLRDRLTAVEATLTVTPDGRLRPAPERADEVTDSVWIFDRTGRQVSGPDAGSRVLDTVRRLSDVHRSTRVEHGDRAYLAAPIRHGRHHRRVGVAVASESVDPYEQTRDILVGGLVALGILVTAGTAAVTAWTVGRTLAPVRRMTELAADWSERDLDSRFGTVDGDDELSELAHTLDVLLDRVAQALRSEQRLTSELAHELRTPLTAIRAEAELGLMSSPVDDDETGERFTRVVSQVDRLNATITTLLAVARHESSSHHRADLPALLRELAGTRTAAFQVAARVGGERDGRPDEGPGPSAEVTVRLLAPSGDLEVAAPPDLVERAVAPVLDNAMRHASRQVFVTAGLDGRDVVVDVSDDGSGIEQVRPESIFRAGVRATGSGGAGLGLPLARRVAASIGGSVEIRSSRAPTTLRIRLPRR